MGADGTPVREIALHLDVVGGDRQFARHADPAGSAAVPRHAAVLLREGASEDLLANPVQQIIALIHAVPPPRLRTVVFGLNDERDPLRSPSSSAISSHAICRP